MTDLLEFSGSASEDGASGRRGPPDPLAGIWEEEIVPMLERAPGARPVYFFRELMRLHPELGRGVRRTLESRIRLWKAENGPDKEVYFTQEHEPGVLGISDFTHMRSLKVFIAGVALVHLLYHFRLVWSGFEHASVVLGSESYTALAEGLQDALWHLGGVPRKHRTDSLSSAYRNFGGAAEEDLTRRYELLCRELGTEPTRNNRGEAHENGSIESSHGHLKSALRDALEVRGSSNFPSLEDYELFVAETVEARNSERLLRIEEERRVLLPLPKRRSADYTEHSVRVTRLGGFTLRNVFYTVPSQLIGHLLHVRLYDARLDVFVGGSKFLELRRGRAPAKGRKGYVVNCRHVIHSLVRKPMALLNLVYRAELFPSDAYRLTFEAALDELGEKQGCRLAVDLLFLACDRCCERELAVILEDCLEKGVLPDMAALSERFGPVAGDPPHVEVILPSLKDYDALLSDGVWTAGGQDEEDGS